MSRPTIPSNPSGAAMEQYIGNTSWANGGAGTRPHDRADHAQIAGMGINVIRLPLVPQTLNANDPQGTGSVLKNHSSVRIANSRLALETMIQAADAANIEVMLDIHSCSNYVGWRKGRLDARPPWTDADRDNYDFKRENYSCASTRNPPTVTTTHPYNTTMWLDNLRTVAGLGTALGVDNIIGIDIFNEPHDYTWAEWKSLTEQAYTAINAVNPNTLLFVQGIGTNAGTQDGTPTTVDAAAARRRSRPIRTGARTCSRRARTRSTFRRNGWSIRRTPTVRRCSCRRCSWIRRRRRAPGSRVTRPAMPTAASSSTRRCCGRAGRNTSAILRQQNYAIVVGEFGGNLDWPLGQASIRDRDRWSHITPGSRWPVAERLRRLDGREGHRGLLLVDQSGIGRHGGLVWPCLRSDQQ